MHSGTSLQTRNSYRERSVVDTASGVGVTVTAVVAAPEAMVRSPQSVATPVTRQRTVGRETAPSALAAPAPRVAAVELAAVATATVLVPTTQSRRLAQHPSNPSSYRWR